MAGQWHDQPDATLPAQPTPELADLPGRPGRWLCQVLPCLERLDACLGLF